jgi:hypothetical protein
MKYYKLTTDVQYAKNIFRFCWVKSLQNGLLMIWNEREKDNKAVSVHPKLMIQKS